ncbi:uncharacterized protein CCR75_009554 [Bremia lactucae]|uniref:Uncharacterized protein n=1 Tax=Bremia lactucae TaxID=4779 RepID=A0A976IBL9_BRELC|nr:hypothetical protein CCR75_009554 [Bremia lactucae]
MCSADETHQLRQGLITEDDMKQPEDTMVRIPVVCRPGETVAQYTEAYKRWLKSRKISLASLQDNPIKERSLWFQSSILPRPL